jgi:hypothetical protein
MSLWMDELVVIANECDVKQRIMRCKAKDGAFFR